MIFVVFFAFLLSKLCLEVRLFSFKVCLPCFHFFNEHAILHVEHVSGSVYVLTKSLCFLGDEKLLDKVFDPTSLLSLGFWWSLFDRKMTDVLGLLSILQDFQVCLARRDVCIWSIDPSRGFSHCSSSYFVYSFSLHSAFAFSSVW